jgi:hypothetical protein
MFINKRILIVLSVVGILVIGSLGFTIFLLLSQSSASANTPAVTPTPAATITATPRLSANRACATGVISSIDAQGQTFVVTEKGAKTATVTTDSHTTYHERGVTGVTFSSLKVGQRVRITSQSACDATASTFTAKAITIIVSSATPTASPTATP